tara:strand:+ start:783 stop:1691 length:909 start_codon:yes stop_codon:yes gene_type:complete
MEHKKVQRWDFFSLRFRECLFVIYKSKKATFPIIALILLDLEFVLRLELNFGRSRMNLGFNDYESGGVSVGHKIALVDDDRNILTSVTMILEAEGYEVKTFTDGEAAFHGLSAQPVDLAILDIKMPRLDGIELLRRLRKKSDLPIIFLTSKDDEVDEILGLRVGADDYVKKPFSQQLLLQRIRSLLRRHDRSGVLLEGADNEPPIVRGNLKMDTARHLCSWKGDTVKLTITEFLILKTLAARPGIFKNRNQLMDAALGEDIYVNDRTIDSHIKRIRKKFKAVDPDFDPIETLYGGGYRYRQE